MLFAVVFLITGTIGVCVDASAMQAGNGEAVLVDRSESHYTPEYQAYLKAAEASELHPIC